MFQRILVPLDGTRFGDYALPLAISIAARTGAWIELAHVHEPVAWAGGLTAMPQFQYWQIAAVEEREDQAALTSEGETLAARVRDVEDRFGVSASARVLHGPRARALANEARRISADLVVMATHARRGLARLRHGDLAHQLVHRLHVPTLCLRPTVGRPLAGHPIQRILVPVDGSDFSEQVLFIATRLARATDARIALLHVVSPRSRVITGMDDIPRQIPHRAEAMEYLRVIARRMPQDMPEPDLIAVDAPDPVTAIVHTLTDWPNAAVTLATHGRDGVSRYVLGSVAEKVLRLTDRPALLYRPQPERWSTTTPPMIPV